MAYKIACAGTGTSEMIFANLAGERVGNVFPEEGRNVHDVVNDPKHWVARGISDGRYRLGVPRAKGMSLLELDRMGARGVYLTRDITDEVRARNQNGEVTFIDTPDEMREPEIDLGAAQQQALSEIAGVAAALTS